MVIYYFIVNTLLFILMGIDKYKAIHNRYRISEKTLLILGLLGGFFGGFMGMMVFRHKTLKLSFRLTYIISMVIHIMLLIK